MTILGSLKSQSFKQWELAQLARHETVKTGSVGRTKINVTLQNIQEFRIFARLTDNSD